LILWLSWLAATARPAAAARLVVVSRLVRRLAVHFSHSPFFPASVLDAKMQYNPFVRESHARKERFGR